MDRDAQVHKVQAGVVHWLNAQPILEVVEGMPNGKTLKIVKITTKVLKVEGQILSLSVISILLGYFRRKKWDKWAETQGPSI